MTMWRGLHDPDYHEDITEYEVERLTAERDALREKVQRVERLLDRCDQDTYDFHWGEGSPVVLTQYVRDALDGGEPDE